MMTNTQIDAKVTEIQLLEAQIKELKAIADSLKGDLKAELDERKVDFVDTGINRVHYVPVAKKVVDTQALKDAGIYEQYLKDQLSTRFTITAATND